MKNWYKSKTFWFNFTLLTIGVLELSEPLKLIPTEWLIFILGIGNLILRLYFTKEAIK